MFRLARVREELARQSLKISPEAKLKVTVTERQADHGGAVAVRPAQVSNIISKMLGKLKK